MKIKNIDFNNIPNKLGTLISNKLVQSIPVNVTREEFIASQDFYKLISAIDIDWNGAIVDGNEINDTSDLLLIIKNLIEEVNELKAKVVELETKENSVIESTYSTDASGDITIINPNDSNE